MHYQVHKKKLSSYMIFQHLYGVFTFNLCFRKRWQRVFDHQDSLRYGVRELASWDILFGEFLRSVSNVTSSAKLGADIGV